MNDTIPQEYLEASKVYTAFIDAVALPSMYSKKAVQRVAEQLELDYDKHKHDLDDTEAALWRNYIHYLKTLKHESN
jgi:hypothetical protein